MEIAVIEKIKRLPKQTEESLCDAFSELKLDYNIHKILFETSFYCKILSNPLTIPTTYAIIIKLAFLQEVKNGQVQKAIIEHVNIDCRHVCIKAVGLFFDASLYGDFIKRAVRYG